MNTRRGIRKCKREREREKKEKAIWERVINYDLPGDFFDCYEGWVDGSTRVSGIRRCIYPSRSCVPSSLRAAIESLYGATLLHAQRLLLFNREKKYFLKTLVFCVHILLNIISSSSSFESFESRWKLRWKAFLPLLCHARLKQNERGRSKLIVLLNFISKLT